MDKNIDPFFKEDNQYPVENQPYDIARGKSSRLLATIVGAAGDHNSLELRRYFLNIHPADAAATLSELPRETIRTIIQLIGNDLDSEVYAELDEDTREMVFDILPPQALANALDNMDSDDAVAFVEELDEDKRQEVLNATSEETRHAIEASFSFEEETAGRLMQREFVAAPEYWDVGRTIDYMRQFGESLPDLFFEVYVVTPTFKPVGAVAVSKLMRAPRNTALKDIMDNLHVIITPETDQEDVALKFQKYHLISAPVVDEFGKINGMITVDDIVQVLQEENQEDLLALAGVSDASAKDNVVETIKSRLPWLVINLGTAFANSAVISQFDSLISQFVALAVLMPIGSALGGNAGTQTLAVAVRALATRELSEKNAMRIILREFATGILNGIIVGIILSLITFVWFKSTMIALSIGLALLVDFIAAALAGILIPLGLKKFGYDPAVASSILVTWITDLVGFSAFLAISYMLLKHS